MGIMCSYKKKKNIPSNPSNRGIYDNVGIFRVLQGGGSEPEDSGGQGLQSVWNCIRKFI